MICHLLRCRRNHTI